MNLYLEILVSHLIDMTNYWFTDRERKQLCVNPECLEHGSGNMKCDIPKEKPEKDNINFSLNLSSAKPLKPKVETKQYEE